MLIFNFFERRVAEYQKARVAMSSKEDPQEFVLNSDF